MLCRRRNQHCSNNWVESMAIKNSSSDKPPSIETIKKPYQKPAFRYEQVFVTTALTCAKTGTEATCTGVIPQKVS